MFGRWSQGDIDAVSEEQMQAAYLAKQAAEKEESVVW